MKASSDVYCIDANVILRYLTQDVAEQFQQASAIMKAVESGEITVFCDPVTLSEVVWALKKYYELPAKRIWKGLAPIIKANGFVIPDKARYIRALQLFSESIDHFGDACACASATEKSGGRVFSFDKDLSGVEGVTRLEGLTP